RREYTGPPGEPHLPRQPRKQSELKTQGHGRQKSQAQPSCRPVAEQAEDRKLQEWQPWSGMRGRSGRHGFKGIGELTPMQKAGSDAHRLRVELDVPGSVVTFPGRV